MSKCGDVGASFIVGVLVGAALMILVGIRPLVDQMVELKKQAIDHGYAEYQTDSSGVTKLVWNKDRTESDVARD